MAPHTTLWIKIQSFEMCSDRGKEKEKKATGNCSLKSKGPGLEESYRWHRNQTVSTGPGHTSCSHQKHSILYMENILLGSKRTKISVQFLFSL